MSRLSSLCLSFGLALVPSVLSAQLFTTFGPPAPFVTDYATDFVGHPFQSIGLDVVDNVRPNGTTTDGSNNTAFDNSGSNGLGSDFIASTTIASGTLQSSALFDFNAGDHIRLTFIESGGGTAGSTNVDSLGVNFGATALNGLQPNDPGAPFLVFPEVATAFDQFDDSFLRDPLAPGDFVEWQVGPEGAGLSALFMIHDAAILPLDGPIDPLLLSNVTSNVRLLDLESTAERQSFGLAFQQFGEDPESAFGWNVFLLDIVTDKELSGATVIPEPAHTLFGALFLAGFIVSRRFVHRARPTL
ncbi:MAG: hypothetical protein ACFBZ8_06490 [Opitutales bacterium]